MNLRVFNQKNGYASNTGKTSQAASSGNAGSTASLNRQIRSLAPGQTLQGVLVSRSGSEVQIRLADDTIMNARLDQNMNLELGKNMTFEVRSNGRALTLSPLFANVATDANTLKALDMASLPINETTVGMTRLLMEAGLPIDKNSLQQVFREINSYPDTDISNIIDLHKLGLPVTDGNVAQIESYKNLTYQLVTSMNDVIGVLPDTLFDMVQTGNVEGAAALYEELLQMVGGELSTMEGVENAQTADGGILSEMESAENAQTAAGEMLSEMETVEGATQEKVVITEAGIPLSEVAGSGTGEGVLTGGVFGEGDATARAQAMTQAVEAFEMTGALKDAEAAQADSSVAAQSARHVASDSPNLAASDMRALQMEISDISVKYTGQPIPGDLSSAELLRFAGQLLNRGITEHNTGLLRELLGSERLRGAFQEGMERLLTIEPNKVGEPKRVEELYQRLDRQLKGITQALEDAGQTSTKAYQATTNMSQNVDFLHQLNQMYTYVQLPLKLQDGNAHGDLYVYTNKRSLAAANGKVSALLHLDMENLGPVDVYVAMQNEKVSTNFYVKDDDMLDFLMEHMDLLTERLKNRGYDCKCSMQVRGEKGSGEAPEGGVHALLAQEGHIMLTQYGFDVRA